MGREAVQNANRVRGPHLYILVKASKGLPFEEGLRTAHEARRIIIPTKMFNLALGGLELRDPDASRCWSGTMTCHVEPDKTFREAGEQIDGLGHAIVYVDEGKRWIFPVPENYRGGTNAILVAEPPDYTLEVDGQNRVVHASWVELVRLFPTKSERWFVGDPKHDIPQGDQLGSSDNEGTRFLSRTDGSEHEEARFLFRIEKRVGPLARDFVYDGYSDRRGIRLDNWPSSSLGLIVEATEAGRPQKLQVESGDNGLLVKGVTLEAFRKLVGEASAELEAASSTSGPENLVAMRRLLGYLKE
jgi:hypothetical protein